jgi:hypothetical protein
MNSAANPKPCHPHHRPVDSAVLEAEMFEGHLGSDIISSGGSMNDDGSNAAVANIIVTETPANAKYLDLTTFTTYIDLAASRGRSFAYTHPETHGRCSAVKMLVRLLVLIDWCGRMCCGRRRRRCYFKLA